MFSSNLYNEIIEIIDKEEYFKLFDYADTLNYMSSIVTGESMINKICLKKELPFYGKFNKIQLLKKIKNVLPKFNRPISAETYIEILNNVRKLEYYQDSNWYPYSLDSLYNVYLKSKWEMSEAHYDYEEELLIKIFGVSRKRDKEKQQDFVNYTNDLGIRKEILEVKFTKVLQKIKESKK